MTEKRSLKDGGKSFKTPKYCVNNLFVFCLLTCLFIN